jgi:CheY-like chemotaxis protein
MHRPPSRAERAEPGCPADVGLPPGLRRERTALESPKPRVLVVEDHEDTREMFAWCMRAAGWHVDTVGDGLEALLATAATRPDAIVMDLDLPVVDGIDAARRLKADDVTADIPIVACTAFTRKLKDRIHEAGFEALLTKPCLPEDLRALVERVLTERSH